MSIKVQSRDYKDPLHSEIQSLLDAISNFEYVLPSASVFKMSDINKKVPIYLDLKESRVEKYEMTWQELNDRIKELEYEQRCLLDGLYKTEEEAIRCEYLYVIIRELKEKRDQYQQNNPIPSPDDMVPVCEETKLRGYYTRNGKSHNPEIVLLMETLDNDSYGANQVAITLIHEMFHAFYDYDLRKKDNYIPFVEEPLTEYAMLKFLEALSESDSTYRGLFDDAKKDVQWKQYHPGVAHYGFGYLLWNHERKIGETLKGIHWVEAFRNDKFKVSDSTPEFKEYAQPFRCGLYPYKEEQHQRELLGAILLNANGAKLPLPAKDTVSFGIPWKQFRPNAYCAMANNTLYLDGDFMSLTASACGRFYEDLRHFFLESFQLPHGSITRIVLWDHFICNDFCFIKHLASLFFNMEASIEVSPRNYYHTEMDGVVYDAPKTVLYYCPDAMTELWVPKQVKRIGNGAFAFCNQLKHIYNVDGIEDCPRNAFKDCEALDEEIVVNHRLVWVPNSATSCQIPDDVRTIDSTAFKYCEKLQTLDMPDGNVRIPEDAFEDCKSLKKEVVFNRKLLCVPKNRMYYTIPDGVKEVCGNAFKHCIALKKVTIPDSVEIIPDHTFDDCSSVTHEIVFNQKLMCAPKTGGDYVIPDDVRDIDNHAFDNCTWLRHVTIPGTIKEIPGYVFHDCQFLRSVTIGEGVEKIGYRAFEGCKLSDVTLPASLKELDAWAFRECPLQTLTFLGTTPPKKTGAPVVEYGDDYICLVRVPKGSKAAYEKLFPDFDFDLEEYEP